MKKIFVFFLVFIFSLILISCDKEETYNITYNLDEGEFSSEVEVINTYTNKEEIVLPIPFKINYVFLGWYESKTSSEEIKTIPINSKGDKTFYARWEKYNMEIKQTRTLSAKDLWNTQASIRNMDFKDSYLELVDNNSLGILETNKIEISNFYQLVMSFNVLDLNEARIEFMVSIGNEENMSDWFTMGFWENDNHRSPEAQEDEFAKTSIDTLTNKDIINNTFVKIKLSVFPKGSSPKIKNVSITTKPNKTSEVLLNEDNLKEKTLDVPKINQMSIPEIGRRICSPTSLTMILNYYEKDLLVTDVSEAVYDRRWKAYGNWTLNASYAGGFSLNSRVEYVNDTSDLSKYIDLGIPLALSIKTKSISDLENSPMPYPAGHLIVLVGFKKIDNTWYAVVNDPAVYNDEDVRREYKLEQLANVMSGYIYVVTNEDLN